MKNKQPGKAGEMGMIHQKRGSRPTKSKIHFSCTYPVLIPSSEGIKRKVNTGEVNSSCGEAKALGELNRMEKPKPETMWMARKNRRKEFINMKRKTNIEVAQDKRRDD